MKTYERFKKTNADGSIKTCKFCGEVVWWDWVESRWYNTDGETRHVNTCDKSKQHYHNCAMDNAEARRRNRAV